MQKRIGALIKDIPKHGRDDSMLVGTYHAIASLLMRRDAAGFGLSGPNFTTLDEDDANSLMKSAFRECDVKPGDYVTPARVRAALSFALNKRMELEVHFRRRVPRKMPTGRLTLQMVPEAQEDRQRPRLRRPACPLGTPVGGR